MDDKEERDFPQTNGEKGAEEKEGAMLQWEKGISVRRENGETVFSFEGLETKNGEVSFRLLSRGGDLYLTDGGYALLALNKRVSFDEEGIDGRIGDIADRYGAEIVGDELRVKWNGPQSAAACALRLFAAAEQIAAIDEEELAAYLGAAAEAEKIRAAAEEGLRSGTGGQKELVGFLRGRCREKIEEDAASAAVYAKAASEFEGMTEEQYARCLELMQAENGGTGCKNPPEHTAGLSFGRAEDAADAIVSVMAESGIDCEVSRITRGAAVVQFELEISDFFAAQKAVEKDAELAAALGVGSVRIARSESGAILEAPLEAGARSLVPTAELLGAKEANAEGKGKLLFVLGQEISGEPAFGDLTKLPHILVGGAAGSGKSVFLRTFICSLISKYSPEDVRFILCSRDGKEFARYAGLPHLLRGRMEIGAEQAVSALQWANEEMERRYQLFEKKTGSGEPARNVDEYNAVCKEGEVKLARIVLIAEEFADLMIPQDADDAIRAIGQKGRAAGIHLVFSTARIEEKIFTTTIKTSFSTRIAFRTAGRKESLLLLDERGAEKLLGAGDMLFRRSYDPSSTRIQGGYLSERGADALVRAAAEKYGADPSKNASDPPASYLKALALAVKTGQASLSVIQSSCGIGYSHAGKIIGWMESMGYVTPFDGRKKSRSVLLSKEEFEKKYGPLE